MENRYFISFVNPHRELGKGLTSFHPDRKMRERYHKVRKDNLEYVDKINKRKKDEIEKKHGGRIKVEWVYKGTADILCIIPEDLVEELRKDPEVLEIYPDVECKLASQTTPWGITKVNAPAAHAVGIKGNGVKIAVLDTGIDTDHQDLAANYKGGYDFADDDSSPEDVNGHGTHVTGIIAAVDNTVGVIGVAPEAWIYALKVFKDTGAGSAAYVKAALEWCYLPTPKVQIVNMSLVFLSDPLLPFYDTIHAVYNAGILMVAAAGNSGHVIVAHSYNANTNTWVNESAHVTSSTPNDVLLPPMQTITAGDAFYIGLEDAYGNFPLIRINVGTAKSVTGGTYIWEFWDSRYGIWNSMVYPPATDGTNFFGIAGTHDVIKFSDGYDSKITINGIAAYYIRARVADPPSAIATAPLGTQMWVDSVPWPARYLDIIAVGATDSSDALASFSSAGPDDTLNNEDVELVGPGVDIYSCWLADGYNTISGTSMACPHVTGVAALYWGANPTKTNAQVRQWLHDNATHLGDPGRNRLFGYGRVYYYIVPPSGIFVMDSSSNFIRDASSNFIVV